MHHRRTIEPKLGTVLLGALALSCSSPWVPLPAQEEGALAAPAKRSLPVRDYSLGTIRQALAGGGVVFDEKTAPSTLELPFGTHVLSSWQAVDGKVHVAAKGLSFDHVWRRDQRYLYVDTEKSTLCDAFHAVKDGGDAKGELCCYDIAGYAPAPPRKVGVSFDGASAEVLFVPIGPDGSPDVAREGVVVRSTFNALHPKGAAEIARMKIVP